MFQPLISLLKSCWYASDVILYANYLTGCFTNEYWADNFGLKFFDVAKDADEVLAIIYGIKDCEKDDWQDHLLNSLLKQNLHMLYDFLQCYFKESEIFGWFVENCEKLQNKKDKLILDAQLQLILDIDLSTKGETWLLCYLSVIAKLGDKKLL